ncbi:hypothetical protein [Thalassobaculum sp.]|uniref:hypothetical protein n=1 Tax=Thalassobaculum sp. TaxID=2022740 RepID=UPI0032F0034C
MKTLDEYLSAKVAFRQLMREIALVAPKENHSFRFISQSQAGAPITNKIARQFLEGSFDPREWSSVHLRALIYDQTRTIHAIDTFRHLSYVQVTQMADSIGNSLSSNDILSSILILRNMIERMCFFIVVSKGITKYDKSTPDSEALKVLLDSPHVSGLMYSQSNNWKTYINESFSEINVKESRYIPNSETANLSPTNILTIIGKVDKTHKGTLALYNILSDFTHPNIGDLLLRTINHKIILDDRGNRFVKRTIGYPGLDESLFSEIHTILGKIFELSSTICQSYLQSYKQFLPICKEWMSQFRRIAHKNAKNNRALFNKRDACPCLSGKSLKYCLKK